MSPTAFGPSCPATCVADVLEGLVTPIEAKLWEMGIVNHAYDWAMLFREGVQTRIDRAEQNLRELNERASESPRRIS